MAALALVVEPKALIVFGPDAAVAKAVMSADADVAALGRNFAIARSARGGLARRLYAGGAWFVWPVLARECGSAPTKS